MTGSLRYRGMCDATLSSEEEWNLIGLVCDKLDEVEQAGDLTLEISHRIAREIIALVRRYSGSASSPHRTTEA